MNENISYSDEKRSSQIENSTIYSLKVIYIIVNIINNFSALNITVDTTVRAELLTRRIWINFKLLYLKKFDIENNCNNDDKTSLSKPVN